MFVAVKMDLYKFFKEIFPKLKHFQVDGFRWVCSAIMRGQSLKLSEISRNIEDDKLDYKQKRKKLERFLGNQLIKICNLQKLYIKFMFETLFEFKKGDRIPLIVDYSDFNGYRILHVGVPMKGRMFPIYFKMFSVKRPGYDLINTEITFLRNLRLTLERDYSYTIIADRGFGNATFIGACKEAGFDFILRFKGNVGIILESGSSVKIATITQRNTKNIIYKECENLSLVVTKEGEESWYLITNLPNLKNVKKLYEQRFWTEEFFRDLKTQFKSRNIKYKMEVVKRLLFLGQICYNFVFEIGLTNKIDYSQYSASKLSFFPKGIFSNTIQL